jgi:hypothetical protein
LVKNDGGSRLQRAVKKTKSVAAPPTPLTQCDFCGWILKDSRELIDTDPFYLYCSVCGNEVKT